MKIRTNPKEMDFPFFLVRGDELSPEEISESEWVEFVHQSKYFAASSQIPGAALWVVDREQYLVYHNGMLVTNMPSEEFIMFLTELAPRFAARLKDFDGNYYSTEVEKRTYQEEDEFWSQYSKNSGNAETGEEVKIFLGRDGNKSNFLLILLYVVMGSAVLYMLIQWL